jgi:hypothetical protein
LSSKDQPGGIVLSTTNGDFDFESTAKSERLTIL